MWRLVRTAIYVLAVVLSIAAGVHRLARMRSGHDDGAVASAATAPAAVPATTDAQPSAPSVSPTTSPGQCPLDERVCTFAATVSGVLTVGDIDAVLPLISPRDVACDDAAAGPDSGLAPLCRRVGPGAHRTGYELGIDTLTGLVFPAGDYREFLRSLFVSHETSAAPGAQAMRLYGFDCGVSRQGPGPSCARRYGLIFASATCDFSGPRRVLLELIVDGADASSAPRIIGTHVYEERYTERTERGIVFWSPAGVASASRLPDSPDGCVDQRAALPDPARAQLKVDDLPAGWIVAAAGDGGPGTVPAPRRDLCETEPPVVRAHPQLNSRARFAHARQGTSLEVAVDVYAPGGANQMMDAVRHWMDAALPCAWEETGPAGVARRWSVTPLGYPPFGDDTLAYRLDLRAGPVRTRLEIVIIRDGDAVVTIEHSGHGEVETAVDAAFTKLIAQRAAERVAALTP
jgi:hypothetical protein